mgnify:CR=1 FL=1|tara:strand:- start:1583 stop:1840 length:258 start_codon:yes stop_codon:yes gene_type:complete
MDSEIHYTSVKFYIANLKKIKEELSSYQTEYEPEKVGSLISAYKFYISKIIEHGEQFLVKEKNDWPKLAEVEELVDKFKRFLSTL